MKATGKKPCVNCTCATTGFCPRGVGANIPRDGTDAAPATKSVRPNQSLRQELQKLPQNRRRMP